MKDRIAIAVFLGLLAAAAWKRPWEVLSTTAIIVAGSVLAIVVIILALAVVPAIRSIPAVTARMRYRRRFAASLAKAKAITSQHARRLARDPASEYIGDLHNNPWHAVRAAFIDQVICPQLEPAARAQVADWTSPLHRLVSDIVDEGVSAARR
ncbi:MAG: hypothetical protein GC150_15255 [Rhizobiales bacterium]|nr:hypothetical protein [Hyphomicrobiales bacterium]